MAGQPAQPSWMTGGPVHDFAAAHRKGLQWGVLGLGLLLLVVWNQPTALVAIVVVLVALALVGLSGCSPVVAGSRDRTTPDRSRVDGAPAVGTGPGGEGPVAALGPGQPDDD